MYINKYLYYPAKVITGFGNFIWGSLTLILLTMFIMPDVVGTLEDSIPIVGTFFTIWLCHYLLGTLLQKAKFYNTFFENDYDGVLELRVISKALGKEIGVVQEDLKWLYTLRLLTNSHFEKGAQNAVILKNANAEGTESFADKQSALICPHCGAGNQVVPGFVYQCQFCSGSLEQEETSYVSK